MLPYQISQFDMFRQGRGARMSAQWGKKHFKVAFIHPLLIEKIIIFCSLKKLKCEFNSVMARDKVEA